MTTQQNSMTTPLLVMRFAVRLLTVTVLTLADHLHLILIGHVQRVLDLVVDLKLLFGQVVQFVFRIVDQCQNLLVAVHGQAGGRIASDDRSESLRVGRIAAYYKI